MGGDLEVTPQVTPQVVGRIQSKQSEKFGESSVKFGKTVGNVGEIAHNYVAFCGI